MEKESGMDRKRREHLDRLSNLPDCVILHILSYLPMKFVAQTSCLSRRWRHLWASVPDLDFSVSREPIELLPKFIDRLLELRNHSKIRKFKIYTYNISHDKHVNPWIETVVRSDVVDLYMKHYHFKEDEDMADFVRPVAPQCIFTCQSLVKLTLGFCEIALSSNVYLPSLKVLNLKDIELEEECLKNMLDGCPQLENLLLKECNLWKDLKVHAANSHLKSITITEYHQYELDEMEAELYAPDVKLLNMTEVLARKSYHVKDLSSLVSADFKIDPYSDLNWDYGVDGQTPFVDILEQICHIEVLELSSWCLMNLSIKETRFPGTSLSFAIKTLTLELSFHKFELPGLGYLLRNSSNVEELILDVIANSQTQNFENYFVGKYDLAETKILELYKAASLRILKKLKIVKVRNLGATCSERNAGDQTISEEFPGKIEEFVFVQFLLENSVVLQKMYVTVAECFRKSSKVSSLKSWLLALPKLSSDVQVIVHLG